MNSSIVKENILAIQYTETFDTIVFVVWIPLIFSQPTVHEIVHHPLALKSPISQVALQSIF
jgi:hypothetical protein